MLLITSKHPGCHVDPVASVLSQAHLDTPGTSMVYAGGALKIKHLFQGFWYSLWLWQWAMRSPNVRDMASSRNTDLLIIFMYAPVAPFNIEQNKSIDYHQLLIMHPVCFLQKQWIHRYYIDIIPSGMTALFSCADYKLSQIKNSLLT